MKKNTLILVAAAGLLLAFFGARSLYTSHQEAEAARDADATRAPLVRPHSPSLGHPDAPVVIVEFIDPACETCRAFYPMVKQMMAASPDRIRLVLRYAPFHRGSDQVVAALEAARKQDRFWPALEALLYTQEHWAVNHVAQMDLAWRHLEGLGLDFAQMRADMAAPETAHVIAQDLEDIRTLEISRTPAFFVNGKPLLSFGWPQLTALVDDALRESERR